MVFAPSLIFVSLNEKWCSAITNLIQQYDTTNKLHPEMKAHIEVIYGDIQSIDFKQTAFVSPANSLGFMDGGVDAVLSRKIFPGVQSSVQKHIRKLGKTTALGRYYLPVGSAIIVPTGTDAQLIVAPTMFLPHNVSTTRNAYYSVFAALQMWRKYVVATQVSIIRIVFTSHCCGYGGMSPDESAKQMMEAYSDL